jgi:broad specificity phosphatase PhoE
MTRRVTLICHGATAAVRSAAFPRDEPLDERAAAAAGRLAGLLRKVEHVRTSPALRAKQTAAALALEATEDALLRDCDYGRWAGRRIADVQEQEPEAMRAWLTDVEAAPHGGEPLSALLDRAARWLDSCSHDTGHVVAITHAAVIRAAIVHAIGAPSHCFWRMDMEPLGFADLRWHGAWTLRAMGPMRHRVAASSS